jgi:hypothetical protein
MADRSTDLNERVAKLGFPVFEGDPKSETNRTLAEVLQSKDNRFWEGFPVMLANAMDANLFDYEQLRNTYLRSDAEVSKLHCLMALSLALYRVSDLDEPWTENLRQYVHREDAPEPEDFADKLKNESEFSVCGRRMSSERLLTAFRNYYVHGAAGYDSGKTHRFVSELLSAKLVSDLDYSLSQVFPAKQKQLVLKKFRGEKLTKTEKEYFSRAVRKKLLALSNQELHQLATKLLG